MKLASVLTPVSPENLRLAAQCGVESIVLRYPGPDPQDLMRAQQQVESFGLVATVVEGFLPIERIKLGTDHDGAELRAMQQLVRNMGDAGMSLLCYNFMSGTDWVRTQLDAPERGGAKVTAFRLTDAHQAARLHHRSLDNSATPISGDELWRNLDRFLTELLPVAESAGVTLAMHPDDPPLPEFEGRARIMNSVEAFERLMALAPAPANAICFCQGTFATMGVPIAETIRRLGPHIRYVHFRDVRGTTEDFTETFHDNGPTDMAQAIRTLREVGFDGPIRPDHVPQLEGEDDGEPGYTMLGRLFAFGYIRGLLHATS